nr:DUF2848 family protein [Ornithinimicrobium cryptoxanthini]
MQSPCLVIAGYTGSDPDSVARHIDELQAIGVAPPPSVPTFYRLPSDLLTTNETVATVGDRTSGEAEPVLIRHAGQYYIGIGSDHTDREIERLSIHEAKAACQKPLGPVVRHIGSSPQVESWHRVQLRSWVDEELYQNGTLTDIRNPDDILDKLGALPMSGDSTDLVLFLGTIPITGGTFHYGDSWTVELLFPDGQSLRHSYSVRKENNHA